eukprot:TRINITY_DN1364_c0_g1_i1.p1 TRINITY_DN1364_c0_g1~~TRINITY_DN1364_c0_g1_i1.p1  ORF type:complete len:98 (+),score=0.99 TRINITY_DN1364_c0_g1_i1:217-510(+)
MCLTMEETLCRHMLKNIETLFFGFLKFDTSKELLNSLFLSPISCFQPFLYAARLGPFFLLQQRIAFFHTLSHGISRNRAIRSFSAVRTFSRTYPNQR